MEAEEISKKGPRVSAKQLDLMISYLETDKNLSTGKLGPEMSKADRKRKWKELTDALNAEGTASKTPDQWRKCWSDQKGYARNKAIKLRTSDKLPSELLTPVEERILRLVGMPSITEQQPPTIVNISSAKNPSALEIKEEMHSSESTKEAAAEEFSPIEFSGLSLPETERNPLAATPSEVSASSGPSLTKSDQSAFLAISLQQPSNSHETTPSKVSAPTELSFVPSLPETNQSTFVAINLQQPNNLLETTPPNISAPTTLSSGPSLPETGQSGFVAINLQQPHNLFESCQPGFVPVILGNIGTEKSEKPSSPKDLSEVNETLKLQLDILKRIATANEQIAHACMIIANKTEERTKELTLQNELIQDINQTLQHVLKKQKLNGDGDLF